MLWAAAAVIESDNTKNTGEKNNSSTSGSERLITEAAALIPRLLTRLEVQTTRITLRSLLQILDVLITETKAGSEYCPCARSQGTLLDFSGQAADQKDLVLSFVEVDGLDLDATAQGARAAEGN